MSGLQAAFTVGDAKRPVSAVARNSEGQSLASPLCLAVGCRLLCVVDKRRP